MPFLTIDEFKQFLSTTLGGTLTTNIDFDVVEKAASEVVTSITGIDPPADANDALPWQKRCVAFIIADDVVGTISGMSQERLDWMNRQYDKAMAELDRRKKNAPSGSTASQTGEIDGLPNTW